jgi:hypothetical protein
LGAANTMVGVDGGGPVRLIEIDGEMGMPSVVCLAEESGEVLVGTNAERRAMVAPECAERRIKRMVGTEYMLLGSRRIMVSELIGAILGRVLEEAVCASGGGRPAELRLTHPAGWGVERLAQLSHAATLAGSDAPLRLIPEPVAAAMFFETSEQLAPGRFVAVYDLGASTLDTAVLSRSPSGFELRATNSSELGGDSFDWRLFKCLVAQLDSDQRRMLAAEDRDPARNARVFAFQQAARRAKELLSWQLTAEVSAPDGTSVLMLGRSEFESLVQADIGRGVEQLKDTIEQAGLAPGDLEAVCLAGGSTAIPMVAHLIGQRLELRVVKAANPKAVTVLGAAAFESPRAFAQVASDPLSMAAPEPRPDQAPSSDTAGRSRSRVELRASKPSRAARRRAPRAEDDGKKARRARKAAKQARKLRRADAFASDEQDLVDCTVFAPAEVARSGRFLVQAYLHAPDQAQIAAALASEFDASASRRGISSLQVPLPERTVVDVELELPGLDVPEPSERLVWTGRPQSATFSVHVPDTCELGPTPGKVVIRRDGIPIGRVVFALTIDTKRRWREPGQHPIGHNALRFSSVFISYASSDRNEVTARVQVLGSMGVSYFQDVLSLDPGERWEQALYRHIDECDLFLLFWSKAAKESRWVRREVAHALDRRRDTGDIPEIRPVILPPPPIELPWHELDHLHFNDVLVCPVLTPLQ